VLLVMGALASSSTIFALMLPAFSRSSWFASARDEHITVRARSSASSSPALPEPASVRLERLCSLTRDIQSLRIEIPPCVAYRHRTPAMEQQGRVLAHVAVAWMATRLDVGTMPALSCPLRTWTPPRAVNTSVPDAAIPSLPVTTPARAPA